MTGLIDPSESFSRRIAATFGDEGKRWLESLPTKLGDLANRWSLTLERPFDDMAYNYVAPVTRSDGTKAVLKVGVPNPGLFAEIQALRCFNGRGAVQLLDANPDEGAMLLERLTPGSAIVHLEDDEKATRVAVQVMNALHRVPEDISPYPTVANWAEGLDRLRSAFRGGSGPFPEDLVDMAEGKARELLPDVDAPVLLHGDLHQWNILSAHRAAWLSIDPKGVIGDVAYEPGAWIRNPFPDLLGWSKSKEIIRRRTDQFSMEMKVDRERIEGWCMFQAVLAAWWSYEDGQDDWKDWLALAELMKF